MGIRIFTFISALLIFQGSFSQKKEDLKESKQLYIHGNSILIGNNILGHHPTKPMMEDDVPNDAVKMKYIDVDDNRATFSSSEATIIDVPENSRVVYAVLYWTGLYPYKKGIMINSGGKAKYLARGKRDDNVHQVLFKTPGNEYEFVVGEVLKDGHGKKEFAGISPYVCRADVTELLQELSDISGTYTVGNIKAAEGKIPGGASAGWLLYVVYEDLGESLKYFTTYDGLIDVDKEAVDLNFSGFRSKEEGEINPTLGIGILEGDRKIRTDQLLVYSEQKDDFVAMSNSVREERNFFNSSITMGNSIYKDRNPSSSNTFGFDLLKLDVPNDDHQFFDGNTTEATLRFQTRADRFYLFFVSFEIEMGREYSEFLSSELTEFRTVSNKNETNKIVVSPSVSVEIKENQKEFKSGEKDGANQNKEGFENRLQEDQQIVRQSSDKESEAAIDSEKNRYALKKKSKLDLENGSSKTQPSNVPDSEITEIKRAVITQENCIIPNLPAGYYLVTNVFGDKTNAKRWREFLISKELTPSTFRNPENDWEYIYIDAFDILEEGVEAWKQHRNKEYLSGLWLMKVNMRSVDSGD